MIEVHSTTWGAVKAKAEQALVIATSRLESPIGQDETNIERGKILALREILALGDPVVIERNKKIAAAVSGVPSGY